MTSLNSEGERQRGIQWPRIVAMLFVQILILLALATVVVRYLEWSSDANQVEFMSATQPSVSDQNHMLQASAPFEHGKARTACHPKAWWSIP
jgi:hypothetical protein